MESNKPSGTELRKVLWISVAIMLLISLPVFLGFSFEGENWRFSGAVIGIEDANSYIAKMQRGAEGDWLFRTPYTTMEQDGVLLYLPYLLLGKLTGGAGQHEQLVALYHLFRIAAGVFALFMTWRFIGVFIEDSKLHLWAWLAAALGGGLGWLPAILGHPEIMGEYPLDFLSPESFGFLAWYGFPHLAAARGLMLWGLMRLITQQPQPGWFSREGLKTGLIFLQMTLCQPLSLLVTAVVMIAVLFFRWINGVLAEGIWKTAADWTQRFIYACWAGLLPGIYAVYLFLRFLQDDYLQIWIARNQIITLPLVHYLLGYGLLLPLVYFGITAIRKQKGFPRDFLLTWLALIPVFVLLPLNIQRRLADGAFVVLVVLAFLGLQKLGGWWKQKGGAVFFAVLLPTSLLIWLGGLAAVISPAEPVFIPKDQVELMLVLKDEAETGDVVLAEYGPANLLPAWAPVTVLNGLGPESANLEDWQEQIELILSLDATDQQRTEFFTENNIRWLWWGPEECSSSTWKPAFSSDFQLTARIGNYSLYEFVPGTP